MRSFLIGLSACCLAGCSQPEPVDASHESTAQHDSKIERDQHALERRRSQLQNRVLRDLRKLRATSNASTSVEGARGDAPEPAQDKLLVFGGSHHEVYLGCLCEEANPESVFKLTGEFGSDVSTTSIRNKFAPYGSNNEDTSACNQNATHPPSVIASDGKALGLLTMNASLKKRIAAPSVADWLARMCRL